MLDEPPLTLLVYSRFVVRAALMSVYPLHANRSAL